MFASRRLLILLILAAGAATDAVAAGHDKSAELMAAYIYNFARFIEWPSGRFPAQGESLVLCSADAGALDGQLQRIHGRQAQNRTLEVRVVGEGDDISACHLLYLPTQGDGPRQAWLEAAAGKPVLTISDQPAFAAHGGMIGLFVAADRVHFEINREAAQSAGLRISSRLLALARARGDDR